jgi:hypothetical protein
MVLTHALGCEKRPHSRLFAEVERMHTDSADIVRHKPQARSRIGNGSALLPSVDGRSIWARLFRDTYSALAVHCGGLDRLSETKRLATRRVSTLEAELVHLEDKFATVRAAGGEPDPAMLDLYGRLADRQRRLAEPLGWERVAKPVETLSQYIARKYPKQPDALDAPADTIEAQP